MGTSVAVVLFAVLIGIGFARSRPKNTIVMSVDRLFVGLVVLAIMLPVLVVGPLIHRSSMVPLWECVAFFAATAAVSCTPLGIAQLFHRMRTGRWWTSSSSLKSDVA